MYLIGARRRTKLRCHVDRQASPGDVKRTTLGLVDLVASLSLLRGAFSILLLIGEGVNLDLG